MSIDSKCDNKIHANICAAIKSLSMQNKFAFAPAFSAEERHIMAKVRTFTLDRRFAEGDDAIASVILKGTSRIDEILNL